MERYQPFRATSHKQVHALRFEIPWRDLYRALCGAVAYTHTLDTTPTDADVDCDTCRHRVKVERRIDEDNQA
jgi:hypothetical protein